MRNPLEIQGRPAVHRARQTGPGPGFWTGPWRLGVLLAVGVLALDGLLEFQVGESPWLRWVRVAAEHPVRVGVAGTLLGWGLGPSRAPPARSSPGDAGKMGSEPL